MFAKDWIEATAQNPLTGEPVRLLDWQINVIENMYGDNCKVKTPNLFIGFVKKTGKSCFGRYVASLSECNIKHVNYIQ